MIYTFKTQHCGHLTVEAPTLNHAIQSAWSTETYYAIANNGRAGVDTAPILINNIPPPKKIVTHAGAFHADELCAMAILFKLFGNIPIERVNAVSVDDLNDTDTLVLDIGRQFNPETKNFDHHHNAELPATNLLVASAFLDAEMYQEMHSFLEYISNVDRGAKKIDPTVPCINSIIRTFNTMPDGFDTALATIVAIFDAQWETATAAIKTRKIWATLPRIKTSIGTFVKSESFELLPGWNDLAATDNIRGLITPNTRGGWQIISSNSDEWQVPVDQYQTFRHNSGFMAVWSTIEELTNFLQTHISK